MKQSKSLYSVCFEEYKLNDDNVKKLQQVLLGIFKDVKKVCDENNIDYMMAGGSLLGTIRHEGFIPWDDDIDIMMTRDEYNKLRAIFNDKLSDKYILAEPLVSTNYFNKMPKIYKKNTKYIELATMAVPSYDMIFIDVFIIENIPNSKLIRNLRAVFYDFAFKGASVCIDYLYPSPIIEKKAKTNKELLNYYNFRKRLGCIFSHLGGMRFYLKFCNKLAIYEKKTNYMGVPSSFSYKREILSRDVFTKIGTGTFCGMKVKIPFHYDIYLKNLYGDYMQIPPVEKREIHVAYKIEF